MKDTYGKREYICDCGVINEDYVWESELKAHVLMCSSCRTKVRYANLKAKNAVNAPSIRTPTKNR